MARARGNDESTVALPPRRRVTLSSCSRRGPEQRRRPDRAGWFIALVFIPLISYSVLATIASPAKNTYTANHVAAARRQLVVASIRLAQLFNALAWP